MHFHLCILLYAHYIMYFPIVIMCHPFKLKLTSLCTITSVGLERLSVLFYCYSNTSQWRVDLATLLLKTPVQCEGPL